MQSNIIKLLDTKINRYENTTYCPSKVIYWDGHSQKSWSVHLSADFSDHKTLIIPSDSKLLYEYVEKHFLGQEVSLTNEAGC